MNIPLSPVFILFFAALFLVAGCAPEQQETPSSTDIVRHVVVFKFQDDASDEQIQQVTDEFYTLENRIPGIVGFEHGINNSPEGQDQDFTHVYLMTFEDVEARDAYLPHPEHEQFIELLGELDILDDVFVVDYVPE